MSFNKKVASDSLWLVTSEFKMPAIHIIRALQVSCENKRKYIFSIPKLHYILRGTLLNPSVRLGP